MTESDPKADLRRYLQDARDALLWKLDGLSEYDIRRPLVPSGTNLLGLVKHVAGVEMGSFGETFGRLFPDPMPWDESDPNSDMFAAPGESREFITGLYRRAWAHSDATIDALPLDAVGHVPWWPTERNQVTLHHMLVRVATETARHAGHADIVRELIDGAAGWIPAQSNLPPGDQTWWQAHRDRVERAAREAAGVRRAGQELSWQRIPARSVFTRDGGLSQSRGHMPEPVRSSQRYLPGLDGMRALAVGAVVAYHLDLGWAQGGMLGVGVFFTLSGYLITDLLLGQHERTGRLQLADFWLRRARRLLPALFVTLAVVIAWVTLLDRSLLPAVRGTVGASTVYVTNWWLIAQHSSYFAQFGPPSPLGHLWSLAVEEQFYLIWPWLLWIGLRVRRRGPGADLKLAAASLLLAVASAATMALLYRPGYDPTRVYDGTDTRAFALLIGAALAFLWPSRHLRAEVTRSTRWALEGAGIAGLAVCAVLVWRTGQYSPFLYRGGMVLLSVGTALMVAAAASPASRFGRILGWEALRWFGVRSYGIYLWHFPIIVLTTPAAGGDTPPRRVLQLAAIIGCAALSWRYVEEPIRRGALSTWWAQIRRNGWQLGVPGRQARIAVAASVPVLVLAGCGMTGVVQPSPASPAPVTQAATGPAAQPVTGPGPATQPATGRASTASPPPEPAAAAAPRVSAPGPARTSCRSVVHIGDSTSEGLTSPDYLPDPRERIDARYARVGVTTFISEISGARSIVETYEGYPNAYTVAQQLIRQGYHGCWVLALGTNDTADVAVGSQVGLATRIQEMMSLIGNQPVMWVNVRSLLGYGPYSEANMLLWDEALLRACARYPDMRVYDWAAAVKDSWFIPDGIHYTSAGYAARAYLIAQALAAAFPARGGGPGTGPPPGCLIG